MTNNIKVETKRNEKGQFVFTTGAGRYKVIQVNGKRIMYSRYVWEQNFGKIPTGMIIHHKNKNKLDNRIKNLELVTFTTHNRIHAHKPWNKDLTINNNKKWADTIKKAQSNRLKTFIKKFKETYNLKKQGKKLKEIAIIQNISSRQVSDRLKRYKELKKI